MRRKTLLLLPLLLIGMPTTAQAAFPGGNGLIAFSDQDVSGDADILTMKPTGSGILNLTNSNDFDTGPTFSANGKKIAWELNGGIWVMKRNGNDAKQVVPAGSAFNHDPSWSPNGKKLVFASDTDGDDDIYTVAVKGPGTPKLVKDTDGDAGEDDPAWSPNGKWIAYESNRRSNDSDDEIYVIKPSGKKERRITSGGDSDDPAWSPDGKRIAFQLSKGSKPDDLYLMKRDGSERKRLTTTGNQDEESPAFSPNGKKLAFEREKDDDNSDDKIYVMTLKGKKVKGTGVKGDDPDWQPKP